MHPAVLDLRFRSRNVIHTRNAPSLCCAAGASSIIFFNVHFFLLAIVMVDFYSFLEGVACGNPIPMAPPFGEY
ncbi:hypothetical protein GFM13_10490 [Rhizobium leguminosarum bv. viciae]|nr:hypothetical protein [Rhizobium leguminosarum bv. viciae]